MIKARARYRPSGSFVAYLFTIAHNVLTDRHRRRTRQVLVRDDSEPDDFPSGSRDPLERLVIDRAHDALCTLLRDLPIAQREAWLMQQEGGMSLDDIAVVTGSSREGVKSRLRYATQKLRAGMQNHARTA